MRRSELAVALACAVALAMIGAFADFAHQSGCGSEGGGSCAAPLATKICGGGAVAIAFLAIVIYAWSNRRVPGRR